MRTASQKALHTEATAYAVTWDLGGGVMRLICRSKIYKEAKNLGG